MHRTRFQKVHDALLDTQVRMTKQYNKNRSDVSYEVADLVFIDATHLFQAAGTRDSHQTFE
ncbi:hypothetical protein DFQ26_001353, partial [Actinomortierella ambigua]